VVDRIINDRRMYWDIRNELSGNEQVFGFRGGEFGTERKNKAKQGGDEIKWNHQLDFGGRQPAKEKCCQDFIMGWGIGTGVTTKYIGILYLLTT